MVAIVRFQSFAKHKYDFFSNYIKKPLIEITQHFKIKTNMILYDNRGRIAEYIMLLV